MQGLDWSGNEYGWPAVQTVPERQRAAIYARMSTERQSYSIENQMAKICLYAQARNIEVVDTFLDAGKSGLTLKQRDGLQRLLAMVESGKANFSQVLVLDVTRWGRFQNADEAALYEQLCRRRGVTVVYVAETFGAGDDPMTLIMKTIKRIMAGEYSRELSQKVFDGTARLSRSGFHAGGRAPYGFSRVAVSATGERKGVLQRHERKSLLSDRVVLAAGPPAEVAIIREIFDRFVVQGHWPVAIARDLNRRGVAGPNGRIWVEGSIRHILINQKLIGQHTYAKTSQRLGAKATKVPAADWILSAGSHPHLIDDALFHAAQARLGTYRSGYTDAELLDNLRGLLAEHGYLASTLLTPPDGRPGATAYRRHFGSLVAAYAQVGYVSKTCAGLAAACRQSAVLIDATFAGLGAALARLNVPYVCSNDAFPMMTVCSLAVSFSVLRWRNWAGQAPFSFCSGWVGGRRKQLPLFVGIVLDKTNSHPMRYEIIPTKSVRANQVYITAAKPLAIHATPLLTCDALAVELTALATVSRWGPRSGPLAK